VTLPAVLAQATSLEPASVALKFGFLAVLYLFLLWVARSVLRDLRRTGQAERPAELDDATGLHSATAGLVPGDPDREPQIIVERADGHPAGVAYRLDRVVTLGRDARADIRLEDPFASSRHAQITPRGDVVVIEDLGSTNGTYLNDELLRGPQPLHPGDRIRIGSSEFSYEQ
jgi:pSer/pThr/pTyr-binding forkhead associated (FHA) protein